MDDARDALFASYGEAIYPDQGHDSEVLLDMVNRGAIRGISPFATRDLQAALVDSISEINPERAHDWRMYLAEKDINTWLNTPERRVYLDTCALDSALQLYGMEGAKALEDLVLVTDEVVCGEISDTFYYTAADAIIELINMPDDPDSLSIELLNLYRLQYDLLTTAEAIRVQHGFEGAKTRFDLAFIAKSKFTLELLSYSDSEQDIPQIIEEFKEDLDLYDRMGLISEELVACVVKVKKVIALRYQPSLPQETREYTLEALAELRTLFPEDKELKKVARRVRRDSSFVYEHISALMATSEPFTSTEKGFFSEITSGLRYSPLYGVTYDDVGVYAYMVEDIHTTNTSRA